MQLLRLGRVYTFYRVEDVPCVQRNDSHLTGDKLKRESYLRISKYCDSATGEEASIGYGTDIWGPSNRDGEKERQLVESMVEEHLRVEISRT